MAESDGRIISEAQRTRITKAMGGEWLPIEVSIATASHPALVNVGLMAHAVYIRLLGLCWELRRSELPDPYCVLTTLQTRLGCTDVDGLVRAMSNLRASGVCLTGDILKNPRRFQFVHVVGLNVKWAHWLKIAEIREDKIRVDLKEEGATPKSASCPTEFSEVFEVLRSIDAKHYRTCQPSTGFERDLSAQSSRLGKGRVLTESESLRTWLEGQFTTGKLRRESNHNPQARLIRWLKRCQPGDDNAHSGSTRVRESYTDRLIREAAEAKAQVG